MRQIWVKLNPSNLAGIVKDREVSITLEIRLNKLGVNRVRVGELLGEGFVGGLGEPALLIAQSHDTHWLKHKYFFRFV